MGKGQYTRYNTKNITSCFRSIDVTDLKSFGLLGGNKEGSFYWSRCGNKIAEIGYVISPTMLNLRYVYNCPSTNSQVIIDEQFLFERTACNFGGNRYWLICPQCNSRSRIVYGGVYFRCRNCHNLSYASENECKNDRAARRIRAIQNILAPQLDLSTFDGASCLPKPKWMKLAKYKRLIKEAKRQEDIFLHSTIEKFGIASLSFF